MAAHVGFQTDSLIQEAAQRPNEFGFFALVRELQARRADLPPVGLARSLQQEHIRLGQSPYLIFAPRSIQEIRPPDLPGGLPKLSIFSPGLFGPSGALPLCVTEFALGRQQFDGDGSGRNGSAGREGAPRVFNAGDLLDAPALAGSLATKPGPLFEMVRINLPRAFREQLRIYKPHRFAFEPLLGDLLAALNSLAGMEKIMRDLEMAVEGGSDPAPLSAERKRAVVAKMFPGLFRAVSRPPSVYDFRASDLLDLGKLTALWRRPQDAFSRAVRQALPAAFLFLMDDAGAAQFNGEPNQSLLVRALNEVLATADFATAEIAEFLKVPIERLVPNPTQGDVDRIRANRKAFEQAYWDCLVSTHRRENSDRTLASFIDIFHHRMLSQFFRAWAINQKAVDGDRLFKGTESARFPLFIGSLIGVAHEGSRKGALPTEPSLLFYAGALCPAARNAESLRKLLADYFELPIELDPFQGRWLKIPAENQLRLGAGRESNILGENSLIGASVWDAQSSFRLRVGPLSLPDFHRFLPAQKPSELNAQRILNAYRARWLSLFARLQTSGDVEAALLAEIADDKVLAADKILLRDIQRAPAAAAGDTRSSRSQLRRIASAPRPREEMLKEAAAFIEPILQNAVARNLSALQAESVGGPAPKSEASLARVKAWVAIFTSDQNNWDLQATLRAAEIPDVSLGHCGRLGWSAWLPCPGRAKDADDFLYTDTAAN